MIQVYGIKNCDSVKKAIAFFKNKNIAYTFHDFKITPVTEDVVNHWLKKVDLNTLFNTKGTTYRTLGLKSLELSNQEKASWMAKENLLIKRPVIVAEDKMLVGFNQSQYEGFFGS